MHEPPATLHIGRATARTCALDDFDGDLVTRVQHRLWLDHELVKRADPRPHPPSRGLSAIRPGVGDIRASDELEVVAKLLNCAEVARD
jgi:hypothetical protein